MPPQPPVEENTRYLPAGVVTIGVEYRDLDPESLVETYKDNAAYLAELEEKSPEGGFADEGVSIHVVGTDDGHEYVRFDVFDGEPHYHYVHNTPPGADPVNNVIDFDVVANGDMLPWAIGCLRERLPEMLANAGGAHLVDGIDPAVLDPVVDEVAVLAHDARERHRAAMKEKA
ncbi:MAG: hypothetical protein JWN29_2690 [Acidimicrobiales bacterium]|nr:hypothetical protein [Acidimicrobiales bacterium]